MPTRSIATPTAASRNAQQAGVPWPYHAVAAAWVAGMLGLAHTAPDFYRQALQEDGFIEWLTVALFAAAGLFLLRHAWRERRLFDLLVGCFCLFVAGEEFSWGQRLLGFTPPAVFLEHNVQQEFTVHNFADLFGKPKGVLTLALLGYALVLPLRSRARVAAVPWFVIAAALLIWYPFDLTGEWVEALAGSAFLVSAQPAPRRLLLTAAVAGAAAAGLTLLSTLQAAAANSAATDCARRETAALLADLRGGAATDRLLERGGRVHKRAFTAIKDGYIDASRLSRYRAVGCGRSPHYLLDPWGMPYWLRYDDGAAGVYSMGPNRRRDARDIVAHEVLPSR